MPPLRRLPRHDTPEVPVEGQDVDGHQPFGLRLDDDVTAIRREIDFERCAPGTKRNGCVSRMWRSMNRLSITTARAGRCSLRPRASTTMNGAGDPIRTDGFGCASSTRTVPRLRDPDVRLRVVVREDPLVVEAVPRVALGAPLAHADAVPPAAAVEQEGGSCRGYGGDRERCGGDGDPDPHAKVGE